MCLTGGTLRRNCIVLQRQRHTHFEFLAKGILIVFVCLVKVVVTNKYEYELRLFEMIICQFVVKKGFVCFFTFGFELTFFAF